MSWQQPEGYGFSFKPTYSADKVKNMFMTKAPVNCGPGTFCSNGKIRETCQDVQGKVTSWFENCRKSRDENQSLHKRVSLEKGCTCLHNAIKSACKGRLVLCPEMDLFCPVC